jgi:hypothetical protein
VVVTGAGAGGQAPGQPDFHVECAATMITLQHAVTAAHCICNAKKQGYYVTIANTRFKVKGSYRNPGCAFACDDRTGFRGPRRCDLAVIELEFPILVGGVVPFPVYNGRCTRRSTCWKPRPQTATRVAFGHAQMRRFWHT